MVCAIVSVALLLRRVWGRSFGVPTRFFFQRMFRRQPAHEFFKRLCLCRRSKSLSHNHLCWINQSDLRKWSCDIEPSLAIVYAFAHAAIPILQLFLELLNRLKPILLA